jgi:hypothetical protein
MTGDSPVLKEIYQNLLPCKKSRESQKKHYHEYSNKGIKE